MGTKLILRLFLFAIVACPFSSFGEEGKPAEDKTPYVYPPVPDENVWEREFVSHAESIYFIPIPDGDVILSQDREGSISNLPVGIGAIHVEKRSSPLSHNMKFFSGDLLKKDLDNIGKHNNKEFLDEKVQKEYEWYTKMSIGGRLRDSRSSCPRWSETKDSIPTPDGGEIRWEKGTIYPEVLVTPPLRRRGEEPPEESGTFKKPSFTEHEISESPSPLEQDRGYNPLSRHTSRYNDITVLERKDRYGNRLWRKVYFYFEPGWEHISHKYFDPIYTLFYFKQGCVFMLNHDRVFLHFDGGRKIFRIDDDGDVPVTDKNLLVFDYNDYARKLVEYFTKLLPAMHELREERLSIHPCNAHMERGPAVAGDKHIADYDLFGELLAKEHGLDLEQAKVTKAEERGGEALVECEQNYRKAEKVLKGHGLSF